MEYGILKNTRMFSCKSDTPVWIDNHKDENGDRVGILVDKTIDNIPITKIGKGVKILKHAGVMIVNNPITTIPNFSIGENIYFFEISDHNFILGKSTNYTRSIIFNINNEKQQKTISGPVTNVTENPATSRNDFLVPLFLYNRYDSISKSDDVYMTATKPNLFKIGNGFTISNEGFGISIKRPLEYMLPIPKGWYIVSRASKNDSYKLIGRIDKEVNEFDNLEPHDNLTLPIVTDVANHTKNLRLNITLSSKTTAKALESTNIYASRTFPVVDDLLERLSSISLDVNKVSLDLRIVFTVPMSLYSKEPVFSSDTLTLRRLHVTNGAQRWEFEAGLSPINQVEILALFTGSGYNKIHFVKTPQLPEIGSATRSNVLMNQIDRIAKAGQSIIWVKDSAAKELKRGEFIRFSNHWKTYLIVESSPNIIKVFPNLLLNVPTTAAIFYNDAVITLCLIDAGSNIGISFDNGLVSNMTCKLVEYINPKYNVINPFMVRTTGFGNVATSMSYADNVLTIHRDRKAIEEEENISIEEIMRRF